MLEKKGINRVLDLFSVLLPLGGKNLQLVARTAASYVVSW